MEAEGFFHSSFQQILTEDLCMLARHCSRHWGMDRVVNNSFYVFKKDGGKKALPWGVGREGSGLRFSIR